jgi:hypothetical protein
MAYKKNDYATRLLRNASDIEKDYGPWFLMVSVFVPAEQVLRPQHTALLLPGYFHAYLS